MPENFKIRQHNIADMQDWVVLTNKSYDSIIAKYIPDSPSGPEAIYKKSLNSDPKSISRADFIHQFGRNAWLETFSHYMLPPLSPQPRNADLANRQATLSRSGREIRANVQSKPETLPHALSPTTSDVASAAMPGSPLTQSAPRSFELSDHSQIWQKRRHSEIEHDDPTISAAPVNDAEASIKKPKLLQSVSEARERSVSPPPLENQIRKTLDPRQTQNNKWVAKVKMERPRYNWTEARNYVVAKLQSQQDQGSIILIPTSNKTAFENHYEKMKKNKKTQNCPSNKS